MTTIARQRLDGGPVDSNFWPGVATHVAGWLAQGGLAARDAVLLLPQAALLASARSAFAEFGGWQPRIETVDTWAASLGPAACVPPGSLSDDLNTSRLTAATLLRSQSTGAAWARNDPPSFEAAVALLVSTAQGLHHAAHARPPAERDSWWAGLRDALPPVAGPGSTERWLARLALAWAEAAQAPSTDCLWTQKPAAWIGLGGVGDDGLAKALVTHAAAGQVAALWLDAEPPPAQPFNEAASLPAPTCAWAVDLEAEACAAALTVLEALAHDPAPVALIAQDRLVVRRTRALLERAGVAVADETGWTLSTTRAAAHVMTLLSAAAPGAGRDALIEALKVEAAPEAAALEDAWRHERPAPPAATRAAQQLQDRLAAFRGQGRRPLLAWVEALAEAAPAWMHTLAADPAGRAVLTALRLDGATPSPAWRAAAAATALNLAEFTAWADTSFEAASFVAPAADPAQVIITPLARAALRSFGAVVFPGCDDRHLGASRVAPTLIPESVASAFGLPCVAQARARELRDFVQLLRVPSLHLLHRTHDADEALALSPLVELAWHARRRAGQVVPASVAVVLPVGQVERRPQGRPAPVMADSLPLRLSASAVEALRACPYRFFARVALGLGEAAELEEGLDKSDHGRWLHAVLHRFHSQREDRQDGAHDGGQLLAAADAVQGELGLDAAAHWPFRAAFDTFVEHYLVWLHERDAEGWRYAGGELARRCAPIELDGLTLDGRLDRVDLASAAGQGGAMLIDYKTGNADKLSAQVRTPLEDTQLAFYAALLTEEPHEPAPRAIYLALDERKPPKQIEHPDVALSASLLVEGLANDLSALRGGAGAPALGEGAACEHCFARGLCRRDDWT